MSKESRRRQRMAGQSSGSGPAPSSRAAEDADRPAGTRPGPARPSVVPVGTPRVGRRVVVGPFRDCGLEIANVSDGWSSPGMGFCAVHTPAVKGR